MLFKLGLVADIHTIVKWHRSCNENANDKTINPGEKLGANLSITDKYYYEVFRAMLFYFSKLISFVSPTIPTFFGRPSKKFDIWPF